MTATVRREVPGAIRRTAASGRARCRIGRPVLRRQRDAPVWSASPETGPSAARAILGRVRTSVRALGIIAAYVVTVGGVGAVLVLTADDSATPWLALLAAMAVVHLGFGLFVVRWSAALLPIVVSVIGALLQVGDFSITTLLVGVPCALLVIAGVSLRIGWDGGPRAHPADQIARDRRRRVEREQGDDGAAAEWDPIQPPGAYWDDAVA
jgi:hypothetical protein